MPAVGDAAPPLGGVEAGGRALVVAFLRHAGCPFAEATMRDLVAAAGRAPDVRFVAVGHAAAADRERWCARVGGCEGVEVLDDEGRELYAAWGLGRSSLRHFLGMRSLGGVAALARRGIRNTPAAGTRWQTAGTFAVSADGVVRWRHLPAHAGELPDLEGALAAARGGA